MHSLRSRSLLSALWLLITLAATRPMPAQSMQGAIPGTAVDSTGAGVPSAGIRITNTDNSVVRMTTADSAGKYQIANLEPGHYMVRVDAPGFKAVDLAQLVLQAGRQLRADARLEVGNISEQMTVDASTAGAIETETASIAAPIDAADVKNLPANYRASASKTSPLQLIQTLPGVQPDTASNNGTGTKFSVQGGLPSLDITRSNFGQIPRARGSDFGGSRSGQVSARLDF